MLSFLNNTAAYEENSLAPASTWLRVLKTSKKDVSHPLSLSRYALGQHGRELGAGSGRLNQKGTVAFEADASQLYHKVSLL